MSRIIAVGTDIIECQRIAEMIAKHGDVFIQRVFTGSEIDYCRDKRSDYQHYAGRWAAKEAVLKVLGTGWGQGVAWTDVEVVRLPTGRPTVRLHNRALEVSMQLGITEILLSISHTKEYAVAFATAIAH
jgi:holo-[acyl-carrier protein] synthase